MVPFASGDLVFDSYHMNDGTGQFYIPVSGYYTFTSAIELEPTTATGTLQALVYSSNIGDMVSSAIYHKTSSSSFSPSVMLTSIFYAKAGDYILAMARPDFGVSSNLSGNSLRNWVELRKID